MLINGRVGSLEQLSSTVDLTLENLADWMGTPQRAGAVNRRRISNLVDLLDAQTQLIVSQHRLSAVIKLIEVMQNAEANETARRACNDLLRLKLVRPYEPVKGAAVEDDNEDGNPRSATASLVGWFMTQLGKLERLAVVHGHGIADEDDDPLPADVEADIAALVMRIKKGSRQVREEREAKVAAAEAEAQARANAHAESESDATASSNAISDAPAGSNDGRVCAHELNVDAKNPRLDSTNEGDARKSDKHAAAVLCAPKCAATASAETYKSCCREGPGG